MNRPPLVVGADGLARCSWCGDDPMYVAYHDNEWGRPVTDSRALFEKICLEGFQSGLAWITVLRKRENFRRAFRGFRPADVAAMGDDDVESLLADAGIIRHRGKIEATINNARCMLLMEEEGLTLASHAWSFAVDGPFGRVNGPVDPSAVDSVSACASALSADLKRRGWRFVGPTTVYSFMQSMGLVNDHFPGCHVAGACEEMRSAVVNRGV